VFKLEEVVPWGRSFDEYRRMFKLTDADLGSTILGCADGPASFNAEATNRGSRVVSCDPLYEFSEPEIRQRIVTTYPQVLEQTRRNADEFLWDTIRSIEELGRIRMQAMQTFLDDYERGRRDGRYVEGELPALPFSDGQFDLALCSHFLFLYSEQLDELFHRAAIFELCRVAREVRIFPLLELGGARSRHLAAMTEALGDEGCVAKVTRVPYEFQRGGNEMLRITRTQA
jgi:hypothetical protein